MINFYNALGPEELWGKTDDERNSSKSDLAEKIMRNVRKNIAPHVNECKCIFCLLIGKNKKYEELTNEIIIDHIVNFKKEGENLIRDYIHPLNAIEEIIKFVYGDLDYVPYAYHPENLTPLMSEMLKRGVSRRELDKVLEKFKDEPSNFWPF